MQSKGISFLRRRKLATVLGAFAILMGAIVALPCATFRVNLTNESPHAAKVRITMRGEDLWSGTVRGGEKIHIPIVEWARSDDFTVFFRYPHLPEEGWLRRYSWFSGYPVEIASFDFSLNETGQRHHVIRFHPWVTAFESSTWRTTVDLGLTAYWSLRCVDCVLLGFLGIDQKASGATQMSGVGERHARISDRRRR